MQGGCPVTPNAANLPPRIARICLMSIRTNPLLAAAIATALLASYSTAFAAADTKKQDVAAMAQLQQRMDNAEKHYRDAMLAEDEDAAATATTSALAEMKAVVDACTKQRGCAVQRMKLCVAGRISHAPL